MARKNAYTDLYRKERKRVQALINRYNKKGYDVSIEIPKIPKRITAGSIRNLQKYTAKYVSSKTFAPDLKTGEIITLTTFRNRGYHRQNIDLNVSRETFYSQLPPIVEIPETTRPTYAQVIQYGFEELISHYPEGVREAVEQFNAMVKQQLDSNEYYEWLEETRNAGKWLEVSEAYNAQAVYEMINEMLEMIDISDKEKGEILSAIDSEVDFFEEFYDV